MKKFACASIFTLGAMCSTGAFSGDATGKVSKIENSFWTGDNFRVFLEPGWSGNGCGTTTNTANEVVFIFSPSSSASDSTYERNFALALTAKTTGEQVTLLSDTGCNGYSVAAEN